MKRLFPLLAILIFAVSVFGQKTSGDPGFFPNLTVAQLAAITSAPVGSHRTVTDASAAGTCTSGGGSTKVDCMWNGSTWIAGATGAGTTIPSTTNLIKGDGAGNGADSGIVPANVLLLNGPGGTPSSVTLTNGTSLPLSTGVSGTLQAAQEPAHTGDVTNSAGSLALSIAANSVTLAKLATQATNTVIGNATSGSAVPTALAVGTCSTAGSALIWTTNTGFGCNTSITASSVTGFTAGAGILTGPASAGVAETLGNNETITGIKTYSPTARSSGSASYWTINVPADTGVTASTESIGSNFVTATRTWADGTVALQRERFFAGVTYNKTTTSATFTDIFNTAYTQPVAGSGVTFTRPHTVGILDSTSASSAITGGLIVATTYGTTATSVGIGGGNINAGGTGTFGGAVTGASFNGNTFTTGTYTLTGTAAKTLNFTNTLTLSGTDSTTMTFPSTSATIARTDAANAFIGNQTIAVGQTTSAQTDLLINPTTKASGNLIDAQVNGTSRFLVTAGGDGTFTNNTTTFTLGAAGTIVFLGRAQVLSSGTGKIRLTDNVGGQLTQLIFGNTTNSFASIGTDAVNGFTLQSAAGTTTWNDGSTANSGTVANRYLFGIAAPTLTSTGTSVTNTVASTVFIGGAPTDSTNTTSTTKWALLVNAGGSKLNGTVFMPNVTTSSGLQTAVFCQASTGEVIADSVACLASSARFKNGINPLSSGLAEIMALRPVSYHYKPEGIFAKNPSFQRERVGLIAEDVVKVDPRLVGYEADGVTPRSVGYEQIIPILINGMKEQQVQIEKLTIEVKELRVKSHD